MKTLLLIIIVISALSLTICNAIAGNLPAQQILEHIDQIRAPSENFTFHIHVHAHTRKGVTENEFDVRVREGKKSLVLYRKPADQVGRALLLDGDNMWIFIPGTSRALRISPQQRLVGAVSNADVARISFHLGPVDIHFNQRQMAATSTKDKYDEANLS